MRVIKYKQIQDFAKAHADAKRPLDTWYEVVKKADWKNLAELKLTYPSADMVGRRTVFNIKGNNYRLIARINYQRQIVFILAILTHEEYDLGRWKE